ncbi:hypothetical protein AGABI2DRAFT_191521 [Agaricus bisporus var. bisporus H97]|uniref:hypothetical protein n=1 Tax=Agaricus bisporus var. bisporus (strain H97 / ATCC MYA-4626 / FGSC 10389) TaxID=936046 RepID=UPI00029F7EE8|nr:hypothetical protein AGABI2DRAFT_191521 [Agaricus bisporus var. bisporus H97]EKV49540.1 hypothetical protein AGABI2DRAFT_191521 [Agaricus bisporus var. bisporus H97]
MSGATASSNSRFYISEASDHKYVLPSDNEEKRRLDIQSKAVNELFDNKLIRAPIELKEGDTVLDSGTGSGHWLLSLSKQVPSTIKLIGIDISSQIFPSPETTPPNATFTQLSITSLPPSWSNTITLIHQRLLLAALQLPEWKIAVNSMYRSLVPGGYVQLFEPIADFISPSEEIRNHKAWAIRANLVAGIRNIDLNVIQRIPAWLEEAGFVDVQIEKRGLPLGSWGGDLGKWGLEASMGFWPAMKDAFMKVDKSGLVANEEEYDEVVKDLRKKCDETPDTYFEYWVFVARKPVV